MTGFCVACGMQTEMLNPETRRMRNGEYGHFGKCARCRSANFKYVTRKKTRKIESGRIIPREIFYGKKSPKNLRMVAIKDTEIRTSRKERMDKIIADRKRRR